MGLFGKSKEPTTTAPVDEEKRDVGAEREVGDGVSSGEHGHDLKAEHEYHSDSEDSISSGAQAGVKKIEAVAIVWSKRSLILAYLGTFLVFYINSLHQQTTYAFGPYVTSAFNQHSLIPTTGVMSSIIGGVIKLPLAKFINIVGRAQGYVLMVVVSTLGLILMAACQNVETYAAAQVFYWVGYNGIIYVLDVFIADTSHLKNRGLMFAFTTLPFVPNVFAGPGIAAKFLAPDGAGFRWGFGIFAILLPVVSLPITIIFIINTKKAKAAGLIATEKSGRTFMQSVKYYLIEFDALGLLLIIAGFALFLLPFSMAAYQPSGWSSPSIIAMLVLGIVCLIAFSLYEKFWTPKSFIPFALLTDRTVLAACICAGALFVSFYCWDAYFSSYLQVVFAQPITNANYIASIYNIGSCIWSIPVGIIIRLTGRFKPLALAALPLMILGVGLMVYFRQPDHNIGYVIMCQIFIAVAGGTLVICEQVAVMAAAKHNDVAVVLALEGMFVSVGGAIGNSISAAIWTSSLPPALDRNLPEGSKNLTSTIFGSLVTQLSYEPGTPVRDAIVKSYAEGQKFMAIAGTVFLILPVVCVLLWRNIDVKKFKQVKGNVVDI